MQEDAVLEIQPSDPVEIPQVDLGIQKKPRKVLWIAVASALVLCLIGLIVVVSSASQGVPKEQKADSELDTQIVDTESASDSAVPVAGSDGVLTALNIDIQWQDDQLSYDVQRVYLVSDLSASASAGLQPSEWLVVFAVQATDTRTFGDARLVPARNYLNIRRQSQDFPPMGDDSQQLLPGAATTIYVPFSIPKTEQKVTGLLGNLRNPYVVELDFQTGEQLEGSFDLLTGFMPALDTESSTPSAEATPSPTQPAESN